jgi:serine/threonine-protein phosphatase 2B regulatory subunit
MGGVVSEADEEDNELTPAQFEKFRKSTGFQDREIVQLYAKYKQLCGSGDVDGGGTIELEKFLKTMNVPNRRVGELMYKILDEDGQGGIDFSEFIIGLSKFRSEAPIDAKIEACFRAYDDDEGGTVSSEEIRLVLLASLDENPLCELDDEIIDWLVGEMMRAAGQDVGGALKLDAFKMLVKEKFPHILDCFEFDMESIMR